MKTALERDEVPHIRSILHLTDLSAGSDRAFAHALGLAVVRQTELVLLNVGRRAGAQGNWKQFPRVRETLTRWGLIEPGSHKSEVFRRLKVRAEKVQLSASDVVEATVSFATEYKPDLLVLGTEGRSGFARWLKPSVAEQVAAGTGTRTLFVPDRARPFISPDDGSINLQNVLVAVDHRPTANEAIIYAARICELLVEEPATIHLLHMGESSPHRRLPQSPAYVWHQCTATGSPRDAIVNYARTHEVDLVTVATAAGGNGTPQLGASATRHLLRGLDCPLLTVPRATRRK